MASRGESKVAVSTTAAGAGGSLMGVAMTAPLTIEDLVGEEVQLVHECKSSRFAGMGNCLQMSSGAEIYPTSAPAHTYSAAGSMGPASSYGAKASIIPWYLGYQPPVASVTGGVVSVGGSADRQYLELLRRFGGARMLSANRSVGTPSSPSGSSLVFDDRSGKSFTVSAPNIEVIVPKERKQSYKVTDFQMYPGDKAIIVYTWGSGDSNGIKIPIPSTASSVSIFKNADGSLLLIPEIPQLAAITSSASAGAVVPSAPRLIGSATVGPTDDNFALVSDTNFEFYGARGPSIPLALRKGGYRKLNVYSIDVSPSLRAYKIAPSQ